MTAQLTLNRSKLADLKMGLCLRLELVSKDLNHLSAILHVYAGGLKFFFYYFSKRKWKYFHTFNHFYIEKSSKRAKEHKSTTVTPNLPE